MVSPINTIRQRIRDANKYEPTTYQKRKASRPYLKGTRQTRKLPGDIIIDERGQAIHL